MILVCQNMQGEEFTVDASTVKEVIPCASLFRSDLLTEPYTALVPYRNAILPIQGSLPPQYAVSDQTWIIIFEKHGQLISDLPSLRKENEGKGEALSGLEKAA